MKNINFTCLNKGVARQHEFCIVITQSTIKIIDSIATWIIFLYLVDFVFALLGYSGDERGHFASWRAPPPFPPRSLSVIRKEFWTFNYMCDDIKLCRLSVSSLATEPTPNTAKHSYSTVCRKQYCEAATVAFRKRKFCSHILLQNTVSNECLLILRKLYLGLWKTYAEI